MKTLAELERHHPRFSRLHEERGHCYATLRQAAPAIDAFLIAVRSNNALPASWSMLEAHRMTGHAKDAKMAAGELAALRASRPRLWRRPALYLDGDLDVAEPIDAPTC